MLITLLLNQLHHHSITSLHHTLTTPISSHFFFEKKNVDCFCYHIVLEICLITVRTSPKVHHTCFLKIWRQKTATYFFFKIVRFCRAVQKAGFEVVRIGLYVNCWILKSIFPVRFCLLPFISLSFLRFLLFSLPLRSGSSLTLNSPSPTVSMWVLSYN